MTDERTLHLLPRDALKYLIRDAITRGNDPEYVDEILETKGYHFTSRQQGVWKNYTNLVFDAANLDLFPPGSDDETDFFRTFEVEGHRAGRRWFKERLIFGRGQRVGREFLYNQRVYYLPVGSLLEEKHTELRRLQGEERKITHKKEGKVKIL